MHLPKINTVPKVRHLIYSDLQELIVTSFNSMVINSLIVIFDKDTYKWKINDLTKIGIRDDTYISEHEDSLVEVLIVFQDFKTFQDFLKLQYKEMRPAASQDF